MPNFMKPLLGSALTAESGRQVLLTVARDRPEVVRLDVTLPGMHGYDVCGKLQDREETACISVIRVTALTSDKDKLRALNPLQSGASSVTL